MNNVPTGTTAQQLTTIANTNGDIVAIVVIIVVVLFAIMFVIGRYSR